jgi:hypothetical protein
MESTLDEAQEWNPKGYFIEITLDKDHPDISDTWAFGCVHTNWFLHAPWFLYPTWLLHNI